MTLHRETSKIWVQLNSNLFSGNIPFPHWSALTGRRLCFFPCPQREMWGAAATFSLAGTALPAVLGVPGQPAPLSLLHWGLLFFWLVQRPFAFFSALRAKAEPGNPSATWAAWHGRGTAAQGRLGGSELNRAELNQAEPNRTGSAWGWGTGPPRHVVAAGLGPAYAAMWSPACLCAGNGNGDTKHVCAASRSRAEFPTVIIILLPSLPAGCQRGGLITAPLLFK